MERELHNTRLDLELNEQCVSMRTNRPDAEKVLFEDLLFSISNLRLHVFVCHFVSNARFTSIFTLQKDPDRADDMLAVEKQQLQRQKRELENHLQCLQSSLQVCKYHYEPTIAEFSPLTRLSICLVIPSVFFFSSRRSFASI